MKYLVVYEKAGNNYSAYVPDLPGCISTGSTKREVEKNIREAIEFHLEGMKEDSQEIPAPATTASFIEIEP